MGRRRAAVLIGIHVLFAAHIAHWLVKGRTLSPVEPSESMYTINSGALNAGFVFFAVAILSTLIFGRFFCGWGCHLVALQDLCGWIMKRLGVKPRPFRSRLLVWAPIVLAVYMFAWPTLKREVIRPVLGAETWASVAPYIGEAGERPEIRAAFIKKNFWETFGPWYMAFPFLGVCGFACVYFLGAKGFCTYGCPYGGIFGPVDRLSVGRILVTDACEHCGHCTAVCSSNVRVHEEVRDFGMVVDPGCMKCMDCVSVCPNGALYWGLARPSAAARKRAAAPAPFKSRVYDLSWKEEALFGALFVALVAGFRGMFGLVPLLMAMGLAGITTLLVWKLAAMVRLPSVRVQNLQLKLKGAVRPLGVAFGAAALGLAALGAWGLLVNVSLWRGTALDSTIAVPMEAVLTRGYSAGDSDKALADRVISMLRRAGPIAEGGIGWDRSVDRSLRLARLHAIRADLPAAERDLRAGLEYSDSIETGPAPAVEAALIKVLGLRSSSSEAFEASLRTLLNEHSSLASVRLLVAQFELVHGRRDAALAMIDAAMRDRPADVLNRVFAADLCGRAGDQDRAATILKDGIELSPRNSVIRLAYAGFLEARGNPELAIEHYRAAADMDVRNPVAARETARLLRSLGRESEATVWEARANNIAPAPTGEPPR